MKHRRIVITVDYNMEDFHNNEITPNQTVKEIVEKDMSEHFGWDEGYQGVKVQVQDEA